MQRYPVRVDHRAQLAPEALERLLRDIFESATREGESASASYGAIARLSVRADRKELAVDLVMNPKVPNDVARETIARYNHFLESATGYSAKERAKRLRKSASETPSGA